MDGRNQICSQLGWTGPTIVPQQQLSVYKLFRFDRPYQRKTIVLCLPSILMDVVDGCPGVLTLHIHICLSLKFVQQWTAGSTAMMSSIKFFLTISSWPKNNLQFCEHIQEIKT